MLPDYNGGSLVNLMSTLIQATGGESPVYPALRTVDIDMVRDHRRIVLLVIDGLGHRYLKRSGHQSCLREHLHTRMTSVFPSTTASAITTCLTGDAPQQHAITGWFMYFKELDTVMTVLRGVRRAGGPERCGQGTDLRRLFNQRSVFNRISIPSVVVAPQEIAHSEFNLAHQGKAALHAYATLAQLFETTARAVVAEPSRRYVYSYWPGLDRVAHEFGIDGPEAAAHFDEIDRLFQWFLERIRGTGTLVVVTADHGMIDVPAGGVIDLNDHPRLAQTLRLPLCGEPRVAYCYPRPERRDDFVHYVRETLCDCVELHRSRDLIDRGFFGLGPPHRMLWERVGDYTLIMKDRFVIKDWLPGETRHVQVGVHGGTSGAEMYVPVIVVPA